MLLHKEVFHQKIVLYIVFLSHYPQNNSVEIKDEISLFQIRMKAII